MEEAAGALYPMLLEYPDSDRTGYLEGYCWRAILQSDLGLQRSIRNLPPELVKELLEHDRVGRVCQEQKRWDDAEAEFLLSKALLLSIAGGEHVEKQCYSSLLVWAVLPLTQVYQSWGVADKLFAALEVWVEILGLIRSSLEWTVIVGTYLCTAQYEWGASESSADSKTMAVRQYAELMRCTDDDAEAQICTLLGVDHECLGNFKASLRWFEAADCLWQRLYSQDAGKYGTKYHCGLAFKAQLLMRERKFPEAVTVLKSSNATICDRSTSNFLDTLLLESYVQMMTEAAAGGHSEQANRYKELAKGLHGLQLCERRPCSICFSEEALILGISERTGLDQPRETLQYHSILAPTPSPIGGLLGLLPGVHDPKGLDCYDDVVAKLPFAIKYIIKSRDLKRSIHLEQVVELVKITKKFLDEKTYRRLLSHFAFPLAFCYQYNLREFGLAMKIWVELIDNRALCGTKPDYLELTGCGYEKMLSALQFEARDDGKHFVRPYTIRPINSTSPKTDSENLKLERDLCFWLYFGHYSAENWQLALKWVRRAEELKGEHVASCKHSGTLDDEVPVYFCCDYDYMLCQAELLMKLQEFDAAYQMLERVLCTKHLLGGSPVVATQAEVWMIECVIKMFTTGSKTADDVARLGARTLLDIYNHWEDEIQKPSPLPTPTGCIVVLENELPRLIQSQVGIEYHLYQLPNPYRLAFQYHFRRGRLSSAGDGVGDSEILFEFEWCRAVLKVFPSKYPKASPNMKLSYEWLMVWATIPLANIYEFEKKQSEVAFQLRMEAFQDFPEVETRPTVKNGGLGSLANFMEKVVGAIFYFGLFKYPNLEKREYPNLKNLIVRAVEMRYGFDNWGVEYLLWIITGELFFHFENFEAALFCARLADKHRVHIKCLKDCKRHKHDLLQFADLRRMTIEVGSLLKLDLPGDADKVIKNYKNNNNLTDEELPDIIQFLSMALDRHKGTSASDPFDLNKNELFKAHMDNWALHGAVHKDFVQLMAVKDKFEGTEEYAKGIEFFEKELAKTVGKDRQKEFFLSGALCDFHLDLVHPKIVSSRSLSNMDKINALYQDVNLQNALKYMEEIGRLLSTRQHFLWPPYPRQQTLLFRFIFLYDFLDLSYLQPLLPLMVQIRDDVYKFRESHGYLPEVAWCTSTYSFAFKEIETFLTRKTRILEFGNKAIKQFVSVLDTMGVTKRYSGYWIELLEQVQSLYTMLQAYYVIQSECHYYRMFKAPNEEALRQIDEERRNCSVKAFVYAEVERAQVMIYQLRAYELNSQSILYQQRDFDRGLNVSGRDHHELEETIRESSCSLQGDSMFVMYSPLMSGMSTIYILNQSGFTESITCSAGPRRGRHTLRKLLEQLYKYLGDEGSRKRKVYDADSVNKILESLHDVLIGPITSHLGKMKPEQKLILCPSQMLAKVPFAALRDRDGKYLIERHTIALSPSLRMLHFCRQRLARLRSELQGPPPHTRHIRHGSIVALGNPKYSVCHPHCPDSRNGRQELLGTGKEVANITKLFEKTVPVVELLGEQATADNLLKWASKPSEDRSLQQAIVHIGAHGKVEIEDHRKSVLQLACSRRSSNGDNSKMNVASTNQEPMGSDVPSTSQPAVGSDVASWSQQRYWEPGIRGAQSLDCEPFSHDDSSDESDISDDGDDAAAKMILKGKTPMFNHLGQLTLKLPTSGSSSNRAGASCSRDGHLSQSDAYSTGGSLHDLSVDDLIRSETPWRAELVLLSACQTARGRVTSEGVLSLARAFIVAGVPSVVASLWKVDDIGTIPLMEVLYRRLRRGEDVATALRSAMLQCMKVSPEIRVWAPFNVWGDPFLQIPEDLHYSADCKCEHIDESDEDEGAEQAIKDAAGTTQDKAKEAAGAPGDNTTGEGGSSTFTSDGEGGGGFAASAAVCGGEAHELCVDPNRDPELPSTFPVSRMVQRQARQEVAMKRFEEDSTAKGEASKYSSEPDIAIPDARSMEITDIDDEITLLEQALAMSMADAGQAAVAASSGAAASDISMAESSEDDHDLAYALQMSMQGSSVDVNQAISDGSFVGDGSSGLSPENNQDQAGKERSK